MKHSAFRPSARAWGSTAYIRRVERLKADMSVIEMAIRNAWQWNAEGYSGDEPHCPVFSYVAGPEIGSIAHLGEHGVQVNAMAARFNKLVRAQRSIDLWNDGKILVPYGSQYDGFLGRVAAFRGVEEDADDEIDAMVSMVDGGLRGGGQMPTRGVGSRRRV